MSELAMVPSRLMGFQEFSGWTREQSAWVRTLDPEMEWDELVLSWNADLPTGTQVRFEVEPEGAAKPYILGVWTDSRATRTSVNQQKDDFARVDTDTLSVARPQRRVTLRIRFEGEAPLLKLVSASFMRKGLAGTPEGDRRAWGMVLEPPRRAQMNYPNGNVICSPTSTSMVLGYWANVLGRPELDHDVPAVVDGVFDPGWNGTGNWPFNTAFAGSQPGLRGYVSRLWGIGHLERWIARGVPVICSVSYALLKGEEKKKANDGHLVVLVGFTAEGDPVFNDPGRNVVRLTYKRADFDRAWSSSGRTVYLVYPRTWIRPTNSERVWMD